MRDLLLACSFGLALPFAIRFTWVAVLLWTWVSLMNPHRLAYGFAYNAPLAAIAAGAALISLLLNRNQWRALRQPVVLALLLFVLWLCITTLFAIYPAGSWLQLNKILKIQLLTAIAMVALQTRRHIELFVWVNVLSIGFYGFKGGLFTIATGGEQRVWGPPGGFIEGNNEVALALVMCLPLMNYLRLQSARPALRAALVLLMGLSVVAIAGSQSRGAFLALLAMAGMLWLRARHKLAMGLVLVLASFTVLALMPESWESRMHTIKTYESDGSALGRINAWWTTFHLANQRFTGGGFDVYTPEVFSQFAPDPNMVLVAHSIYFSVLGEHGWVGLVLFLLVWWLALRLARRNVAVARAQPDAEWARDLALMCGVSLAGYAVGGAFLSLAYFDLPYNIIVLLVTSHCALKVQSQRQGAVPVRPLLAKARS